MTPSGRPVSPTANRLAPTLAPRWRHARVATVATFFACGFVLAGWVVHIPAVMHATGLEEAGFGTELLLLGAAALVAMQVGGVIVARIGSRVVIAVGSVFMVGGAWLASWADTPWLLCVALVIFGLGNGAVDLAMNEQAVRVERAYARPIMGSFHAWFSVGGAVGAVLGGVILTWGWPAPASLGLMAGLAFLVCFAALAWLLAGRAHEAETGAMPAVSTGSAAAAPKASVFRLGLVLALMAFGFFLAEGTVTDWSARHATTHLGVTASVAAAAYAVFSTCMTIGRFAADKVVHRIGAVPVIRYGALLAGLGLLIVVAVPWFPAVLLGWGIYGIGLSGIVPQLFTAAGSLVPGPRGAVVLSRVVGAGYAGMLAGPAVVGWLAGALGLNQALLLPLVLCLAGCGLSFVVGSALRPAVAGAPETAEQHS